jgi:hypothetical protein
MQTICRLIQLTPEEAERLVADPASLSTCVRHDSDVYRYWHAIEYLLARHQPGSAAARWLSLGTAVSSARGSIPGARVLSPAQVQELDADLREIQPEDFVAHYDAAALDAARVYPATWQAWEEEFDPLGQVLEHYSFLMMFTSRCAKANAAALLYFEELAEGTV